jgi:hypothetical protein
MPVRLGPKRPGRDYSSTTIADVLQGCTWLFNRMGLYSTDPGGKGYLPIVFEGREGG